ncbi:hypothetical protein CEXT_531521 [Caerostris extrusa]|uniref:Uncharacterized protein n=1 Tax=Caerostris extrusa TaxID=172846 RepID=A0AAV4XZL9_CAEEX|nr:hypothetical protein CEXT_531521 [Caerostris extrusa]
MPWRQCPKYPKINAQNIPPTKNSANPNNVGPTRVTSTFSYANALSTNLTSTQTSLAPAIPLNQSNSDTIFSPDELHKTLYILKEIVSIFTSSSSVSTVFQQLNQAKTPEDKLLSC